MRVAMLSPMPPERNGIADYARHFGEALQARGVDLVWPLEGVRLGSRAEARRWADGLSWDGVDVVHVQFGGGRVAEFLAAEALAGKRWTGRRPLLTATVHDPERLVWRPVHRLWSRLEERWKLPRPLLQGLALLSDPLTLRDERRLARALDGIVTLTRTGALSLSHRLGVPHGRIAVIGHGMPTIEAAELPPVEPLRLLYFGFIYRGKGIEDLLDAMARVMAVLPGTRGQVRLTLAGGTAPSTAYGPAGDYLGELRARVASLGLEDLVDWRLDLPEDGISTLIQQHHAVVLPYRESRKLALLGQMRGTSGALAWAFACGRGAITSNARSFAEEIGNGNGLAYLQGDVRALAACIASLVRVPDLAWQWAETAERLAAQRTWPQTALQFERCFTVWREEIA